MSMYFGAPRKPRCLCCGGESVGVLFGDTTRHAPRAETPLCEPCALLFMHARNACAHRRVVFGALETALDRPVTIVHAAAPVRLVFRRGGMCADSGRTIDFDGRCSRCRFLGCGRAVVRRGQPTRIVCDDSRDVALPILEHRIGGTH